MPPAPAGAVAPVGQRLHPAALGVWAVGGVRTIVLLIVAGSFNIFAALVFVVVAAAAAGARWLRFRWRLESDALVIEQGVVQRQRRVIPLERIQSVEVVRKLAHRVFGVVELRVESIGGGTTEGQLDALDPALAEQLRTQLLRKGNADPHQTEIASEGPTPPPLVRMRPRQLVLAGLTGGRVGVFAAIVGFASQALGERVGQVIDWVTGFVGATETTGVLSAAIVMVAGALVIAFLLSIVATTLTFWNFTLTRDERNLYTTRGLFDQRSGTIPLHRVQSVRVEENAVRRGLGLAAVKVEVAGHAGADGAQETSMVLPLGGRAAALRLAGTILDREGIENAELTPMPGGARDRRLVRAGVAAAALTVPAVWWLGVPGLGALGLAAPFALLALASYRALGHAEPEGLLLARSGLLVRTTHATRERALQAVSVSTTPFQRRRGLATLDLHIARSPGGGGDPAVIDVTAERAHAELLRLARASDELARRGLPRAGLAIRPGTEDDAPAIQAVTDAALPEAAGAGGTVPTRPPGSRDGLSLVVDDEGEVVGHARLTTAPLAGHAADGKVRVLRPVAIHPDRRGEDLEGMLVKAALAAAARQGAHRVLAVGDPAFLEPLGFEPAEQHGLEPPPRPGGGTWLVRVLPGDDGSATGRVEDPAARTPE